MKLTNVKAMLVKVATVGAVAAAMVIAAPAKANAQVSFGVRVGPPVVYGHYGPEYRRGYYAPEYGRGYYGRPYGYGYGYGHPVFREYGRRGYWR